MFQIPDHAYLSPKYGGLGWTKASILTLCAFVRGCRNAICEFSKRFADWEDSLLTTQNSTVFALNEDISFIEVEKWSRCFPQSFNGNSPEKHLLNLKYTLRTLQKRLIGIHTVFNVAQTAKISCIKEPLLKETLSLNNFGSDDRGDVYCDWIDNFEAIVDFVSYKVANDTLVHRRKLNPVTALDLKAKEKHRKYDKDIEEANADRNTQLVFIAFLFSINGKLSDEAETLLNDFQKWFKKIQ
ncbi:hypothetical protein P9112_000346 [Eukaryota sp. TZLM1-RC]